MLPVTGTHRRSVNYTPTLTLLAPYSLPMMLDNHKKRKFSSILLFISALLTSSLLHKLAVSLWRATVRPMMGVIHRLPSTVLEEICRWLLCLPLDRNDKYRHVGSRTIAALAVTARLFLEPALDTLWNTIPDIAILFFALDKEAYSERQVWRQGRLIESHRQFASLLFHRIFTFANRPRL